MSALQKPVYRMSSSGACPRILAAERLDYEPVPKTEATLTILKESSRHEDFVIEDLETIGFLISDRQKEYTLETPLITLVGHIDGIATRQGKVRQGMGSGVGSVEQKHLLEVKALGRFTFDKFKRQGLSIYPEYQAQITCYAEAAKFLPILLAVKCRDTGEIIKRFLDKPPMDFNVILDKLHEVELCVRDGVLPEVTFDEKSDQCRWCRFRYLCTKEEKEETPAKEVTSPTLLEAAELYKEGKQYERMAEERIDQAKNVFIGHAKEQGLEKFRTGGLSISWLGERTKRFLSEKRLKELVDEKIIEQCYMESKVYPDLRIRLLKEE